MKVSELNNSAYNLIQSNFNKKIVVEGEISSSKISRSHLYFSLKDDTSSVSCVCWDFKKHFGFEPKDGQKVNCSGYVDFYKKQANFQFRVIEVELIGLGDIHTMYQELLKQYGAKGYFKTEIKKKMPVEINNLGIITAKDSAAIQDVLYVLRKNKFTGNIFIKNSVVQGVDCPKSIQNSIEYFNGFKVNNKPVDMILITRGGGSYDDLIGFSSECVIEAIYKSDIFVMSAIGHEVDWMLSDYAADYRAPTPSIAAETITNSQKKILDQINESFYFSKQLENTIRSQFTYYESRLAFYETSIHKSKMFFTTMKNTLDSIKMGIRNRIYDNISMRLSEIASLKIKVAECNPKIKHGESIITDKNGQIVNSVDGLFTKDKLKIVFSDGSIKVSVKSITEQVP